MTAAGFLTGWTGPSMLSTSEALETSVSPAVSKSSSSFPALGNLCPPDVDGVGKGAGGGVSAGSAGPAAAAAFAASAAAASSARLTFLASVFRFS